LRLIDSHAHLADERFADDLDDVLGRARDAGVEAVVAIGFNLSSSLGVVDLLRRQLPPGAPALCGAVGFAPHNVTEADPEAMAAVRALLDTTGVVAVGEIGLDYHYDMPPETQRAVFGEQLGWAVERELPVVIHSREAADDMVRMLTEGGAAAGTLRGVIHCFTEEPAMAEKVVDLGFYVSFSGIATFKNAPEVREAIRRVPLERTLIETDAPFLAPVPHRGKRNEPAFVSEVARCVAEIHGRDAADVAEITAANCRRLFRF
jgi:TatD DNase family protein